MGIYDRDYMRRRPEDEDWSKSSDVSDDPRPLDIFAGLKGKPLPPQQPLEAPTPSTATPAKTAPPSQTAAPKNNHRRHLIYLLIGATGVALGLLAGKLL